MGRSGEEGVLAKEVTPTDGERGADGHVKGETVEEDEDFGKTNGSNARRWLGGHASVSMQTIDTDHQDHEGAGEGGEVGDGGGVLRRLDPALCFSVRAREWLEGLSWRRALAES